MTADVKRRHVTNDMSGHCRFGSEDHHHRRCRVEWDTPSATVTCCCPCHAENGQRAVVKKVQKSQAVVKRKMVLARADDDV